MARGDQVILHHTEKCWMAEFRGPIAREMTAMTGVDILPTGFSGHLPAVVVCSAIALLNANAEIKLADGTPDAQAKPGTAGLSGEAPAPTLVLAAQVVSKYARGGAAVPEEKRAEVEERRSTLKRAMKIRKGLGLMVACSYLKDRGWNTDAAYQALNQPVVPRKPVTV